MIFKKQTANYWWQQAMRIKAAKEELSKHDIRHKTLDEAWWKVLEKYLEALCKEGK